jgi:MFS family permease
MFAALPFYAYEQTESAFASGAVLTALTLPGLLIGTVAGERRRALRHTRCCDVRRQHPLGPHRAVRRRRARSAGLPLRSAPHPAGRGGLTDGVFLGSVATRVRPEKVLVLSLVSVGIVTLVFATVPLTPVTMACAVALGIPAVGWIASQQTLLQNSVADEYLGRIFGAFSATTALMLFVGGLSAGALGDIVGIVPLLIISAATYRAAALLALMLLGRTHTGGREQKK